MPVYYNHSFFCKSKGLKNFIYTSKISKKKPDVYKCQIILRCSYSQSFFDLIEESFPFIIEAIFFRQLKVNQICAKAF